MSMILKIAIVLLVFTVIVIAHEFGHFIMAKRSGVFVQEFAVGMGPKLLSKQWGETLYSLRAFPIGGFCMMQEEVGDSGNARSLSSKTIGQRMGILFAGPFMNFLLAFLLMFIITASQGEPSNIVGGLSPDFPAQKAGMQVKDKIVKINGIKTNNMKDITKILKTVDKDETVVFTIDRDGKLLEMNINRQLSLEDKEYLVGFIALKVRGNIIYAIPSAFSQTINLVKMTIGGFFDLITMQLSVEQLSGPVGVITAGVQVWDEGVKESIWIAIQRMFFLGALISANLGVFNLFPFPALDGGRILFLGIEAVRGKPVNPKVEGFFHFMGFALLMLLMVFVLYNDISNLR